MSAVIKSVSVRQTDIEDNQTRVVIQSGFGFSERTGEAYGELFPLQKHGQAVSQEAIIFDDKNVLFTRIQGKLPARRAYGNIKRLTRTYVSIIIDRQ